ncbi:MAG: DUF4292 domain-containing protein [Bacteroidaceae bacterium]|nr:DUF4292 domain-containing protein [Bacteroidaceae bacterium]
MRHSLLHIICFITAMVILAACSTSRKVAGDGPVSKQKVAWKTGECIVAKTNIHLSDNTKKLDLSVNGTLRMKRDDVVQLSATYLFGIQVGTLEITPEAVTIISRATRQYAILSYEELSSLTGRALSFDDLQDIFWGEAKKSKINGFEWKYESFSQLPDNRPIPSEIIFNVKSGAMSVNLDLEMQNHRMEEGWSTRTSFNQSSYTRLKSAEIIKIISNLTVLSSL